MIFPCNNGGRIQSAIDQGPGVIQLGAGTFQLRAPLVLRSGVRLVGQGPGATILEGPGIVTGFDGWDASRRLYRCGVEHLAIVGGELHLGSATQSWAADVDVRDGQGVRVDGVSYVSHLTRVRVARCSRGFRVHNGPRDLVMDQCSATLCATSIEIDQDGERGVGGITIERGTFQAADEAFVDIRATSHGGTNTIRILRNRFEGGPIGLRWTEGVVDLTPTTHEADTNHYQSVPTRRQPPR